MSTGIVFPLDLAPDANGFADSYEDTSRRMQMEVGEDRVRRRMRRSARRFEIQYTFDQEEFATFKAWWLNDILGNARKFDVRILDRDETLMWFTCRWIGEYKVKVGPDNLWIVSGTVRTVEDSFEVRVPGTDQLHGRSSLEMFATGRMLIGVELYGRSSIEMINVGHFTAAALHGRSNITLRAGGYLSPIPISLNGRALLELTGQATFFYDSFSGRALMSLTGIGVLEAGESCPDYSDVTLRLTDQPYTPDDLTLGPVTLKLLPCPYTPPTVV